MDFYWISSQRITIGVEVNSQGIIVQTAPIANKFREQPLKDLVRWMNKQGGLKIERLTMNTSESQLLAKLDQSTKTNYEEVKKMEKDSGGGGGKRLPAGLKDAVCQIIGTEMKEYDNDGGIYLRINAITLEPAEYSQVPCNVFLNLQEDRFNSESTNQNRARSYFENLGYEELVQNPTRFAMMVNEVCTAIEHDKPFVKFNTGNKLNKNGYATVFHNERMPSDYQPPALQSQNQSPITHQPADQGGGQSPKKGATQSAGASHNWEVDDACRSRQGRFDRQYAGVVQQLNNGQAVIQWEDGDITTEPLQNIEVPT